MATLTNNFRKKLFGGGGQKRGGRFLGSVQKCEIRRKRKRGAYTSGGEYAVFYGTQLNIYNCTN